jgi:phosphatidylinositol glycan class U
VYVVPLTLRFWHNPLFLFYALVKVGVLFKPYPVFGDYGFAYVLFAMQWPHMRSMYNDIKRLLLLHFPNYHTCILRSLISFSLGIRRIIPVVVFLIISVMMGHLMWYQWIYLGSGNANFYYNQTLLFIFSNGFVLIEAISAVRKLYTAADSVTELVK